MPEAVDVTHLPIRDRLATNPRMTELLAGTETFPQRELPREQGRIMGGLNPHMFGSEKSAGYLPRQLVEREVADGFISRNQVAAGVLTKAESTMRMVEKTAGVKTLEKVITGLESNATSWADGDSSSQSAAEYVYTIKGLATIATSSATEIEQGQLDAYLQQVPEAVRARVGERLQTIYNDTESIPKSSYAETDESRKYFRAIYALMNVKDNISLTDEFKNRYPHLLLDDERAMDMIYESLKRDEAAGKAVQSLATFYNVLSGPPNAPSYADFATGQMGLGRTSSAELADAHQLPIYRKRMGLGRTVLPTAAVTIDGISHQIANGLQTDSIYSPEQLAQLFSADRLLLGTPDMPGMIARVSSARGNGSYIDRVMAGIAESKGDPSDALLLTDFMAGGVQALDLVSLAREPLWGPSRAGGGRQKPFSLYLAPEVTPEFVGELEKAQEQMVSACEELGVSRDVYDDEITSAINLELSNAEDFLFLLSSFATHPENSVDSGTFEFLDSVGTPIVTAVAERGQSSGTTVVSWATVPVLVERELEVSDGSGGTKKVKAYGVSMLPFQGLWPKEPTRAELAELYTPDLKDPNAVINRIHTGESGNGVDLPYYKPLVYST